MLSGVAGRTVWLVGMMGAGKSTVGPALARALGLRFVDTDARICEAAGATIAELFARDGETAFRERERAEIEVWADHAAVVALGGGAIAQPGVADRLAETGVVVYLRARPETLLRRLGDCASRPLLRDLAPADRRARLAQLLEARRASYEGARIVVDTDEGDVAAIVAAIGGRLTEAGAA